ncbi:MAG TPA: ABC transporter permease subunit [Shinella sp.]|jgi:ABC-type transport system involved in multi-copper enzyme maturation permease subunit|uniref:ABC transporter permease subunit n=1 Tax=Shinella sp. TaxID=1870904 RepID=UPI002E10FBF0|nr:ABC transporter permease subunit [Shinella sp.]
MEHVRPPHIFPRLHSPGLARQTFLLVRREVAAKFASLWFWLVASALCLIAYVYGIGFARTFETESVVVTADPLAGLNTLVVAFLGLVLGLRLAGALSWEREHRTLDVLLVGPVPLSVIVLAKYLAELAVLAALVAVHCLYLVIAQPLGAGVTGAGDFAAILANGLFVLPVMAMGLAVSGMTASVRMAVVLYLALVALLATYEVVLGLLRTMPADSMSLFSLYLRALLEAAAPAFHALSPVAGIAFLAERLVTQQALPLSQSVGVVTLTAGLLLLSWIVTRMKGA